jgi:hypothetical protein
MSHREVPFARVIGLSWLRTFDAPRHLLDATRVVRRYWALLGNSDGHSTAQMSKVRRELEEAFEDLEQISDLHVQSDQFFTSDNLTKIVAWTQKASHVRGHYQLIAGGIAP